MTPIGPTKVGKYEVEERVGEGAMGVVYRAIDPVLKRRVAVKVMSEAFAQNTDLRERFLREAQAAGSLQHPNVITIYDFGEVDGHLYIAMEFVEGQDVAELLAHQVPLSLAAKLDIAIGVLQGLAFAHKRGIVHRDIKPANIRVDCDGNARIMDFGVAHFASSNMTRTGVMIGTPSYMAPEQITSGTVGPQSDIFSVGAVLYELLTGTSPFAGGSLQAVMYRVLSETPTSPGASIPGLPPKLNDIVLRALAKEPAQRYASALDMANDLAAVRTALDERASSPGTLSLRATIESALDERRTSAFRAVRRRRFAMAGVGVVAAAVLVLAGFLLARPASTPSTSSPTTTVADPRRADSAVDSAARTPAPPTVAASPDQPRQTPRSEVRLPVKDRAPISVPASRTLGASSAVADTGVSKAKSAPGSPQPQVTPSGAAQPVTVTLPPVPAGASSSPPNAASPTSSSGDAPKSTPAPPSVPPPSANADAAAAEIAGVIDAYARAIESRDMGELRRVYAAITAEQASAFADFFKSTKTLRAALAARNVRIDGNKGTARVSGTYEFTTTSGRAQQQQVSFEAELRRDGSSWKLVAIR